MLAALRKRVPLPYVSSSVGGVANTIGNKFGTLHSVVNSLMRSSGMGCRLISGGEGGGLLGKYSKPNCPRIIMACGR